MQRHTLIQTISRVNRKYPGKDSGLAVDYIGIKENMMQAIKQFGGDGGNSIENIEATLKILRNHAPDAEIMNKYVEEMVKLKSTNRSYIERKDIILSATRTSL